MGRILANLRLGTKFLLSMVVVIAGLTWFSLLMVRETVQARTRQELTATVHNSLLILERLQRERQAAMSRKADLLATSAYLSDNDPNSFQDSATNALDTSRTDLMVLADNHGTILSMHATQSGLSNQAVEKLLRSSVFRNQRSDWWFDGGHLYAVELQPIGPVGVKRQAEAGTVVVGQEFDQGTIRDLGRLLASDVAVRYKGRLIASNLDPYRELQLSSQLQTADLPDKLRLGSDTFFVSSINLTPDLPGGPSLIVLKSDAEAMAFLNRLNSQLLKVGFFAVVAGCFLAFVISHTFTAPLGELVGGVHALERGNFKYPLKLRGKDEVAEVTQAFDRMRNSLQRNISEKEALEEQLRQSQKMEALGRLAGGVAHDFNNLLTIIKGHSDLLLDWLPPAEAPFKSCEQIHKAADRATALTRQLLVFSRKQVLEAKVLDLNHIVREMDKMLGRLIREDVEYTFVPGVDLKSVKADPGQLEQVILNLTVNACDAMPYGGKLTIETRNVYVDTDYGASRIGLAHGSFVLLSATDTGTGMDAQTQARMFEPFFTTKEVGKGTGLGLATVHGIVRQNGGYIQVQSAPGKGTRFEVYLPTVAEQPGVAKSEKAVELEKPEEQACVLVVEDDAAILELAGRFLKTAGHQVVTARDGVQALEIVRERGASIGVVVTDVVMPKMRGTELAARLGEVLPEAKVIFMSGYLEHNEESRALVEEGLFLQKPFTREGLIGKVNEALRFERLLNPRG